MPFLSFLAPNINVKRHIFYLERVYSHEIQIHDHRFGSVPLAL